MEREKILERVIERLSELFPDDGEELSASTPLSETALLDSFAVLEVVMFLETEFDLNLDRSDLDSLDTAGNIVDLIIRKQSSTE